MEFKEYEGKLLKEIEGAVVVEGIAYEEVNVDEVEEELANIAAEIERLNKREEELKAFLPEEDGEEDNVEEENTEETPQY